MPIVTVEVKPKGKLKTRRSWLETQWVGLVQACVSRPIRADRVFKRGGGGLKETGDKIEHFRWRENTVLFSLMNLKMSIRMADQAGCVWNVPKCNAQLSMIFTELTDVRHRINHFRHLFSLHLMLQSNSVLNSGLKLTYHNAVCFGYLWSTEHESCSLVSSV